MSEMNWERIYRFFQNFGRYSICFCDGEFYIYDSEEDHYRFPISTMVLEKFVNSFNHAIDEGDKLIARVEKLKLKGDKGSE